MGRSVLVHIGNFWANLVRIQSGSRGETHSLTSLHFVPLSQLLLSLSLSLVHFDKLLFDYSLPIWTRHAQRTPFSATAAAAIAEVYGVNWEQLNHRCRGMRMPKAITKQAQLQQWWRRSSSNVTLNQWKSLRNCLSIKNPLGCLRNWRVRLWPGPKSKSYMNQKRAPLNGILNWQLSSIHQVRRVPAAHRHFQF